MTCKDVQLRLQAYLDGDLPHAEAQAVQLHLGQCLPCAKVRRDYQALVNLARSELKVKSPDNFDRVLKLRLKARSGHMGRRVYAFPSLGWSAAAMVALGLMLLSALLLSPEQAVQAPPAVALSKEATGPVVVPSDPETPGAHLWVPEDQEEKDGTLVQIPPTVTITRQHLTQDFFLTEVSH